MEITKELIDNLYTKQRLSTLEVCKLLGICRTNFYKYLKKFNIYNHGQQKYFPNENFFSTWSHEMAYCVGFISADGHVWEKRPFLSIGLHERDIDTLTYIKNQISPMSLVRANPKHKGIQLTIKSHQIWSDLKKYNITHDKTFDLKIDFDIPKEFWGDYLRGYFDGDGSIWIQKNRKTPAYAGSIVGASRQILDDICDRLGFGYTRSTHAGKYFSLDFSHKQLFLLKDIIYKDPSRVVMYRKYNKFCDMRINEDYVLWTKEEDLLITNNISLKTREIAKLIPHRTKHSVQTRKNKLVKVSRNNAD